MLTLAAWALRGQVLSRVIAVLAPAAVGYKFGSFAGFIGAAWLSRAIGDPPWFQPVIWAVYLISGPAVALALIAVALRLTEAKDASRAMVTAAVFGVLALVVETPRMAARSGTSRSEARSLRSLPAA